MSYKWWILIAIGLFGLGIALGLVTPSSITRPISEELSGLVTLDGMTAKFKLLMVIFIFIKNALVLLFSFAFSPLFCLMPILALTVNGWLLTVVSTIVAEEKSLGFILASVLPHGIIELPAFFIGEAAALSFGVAAMVALFKKERRALFLPSLKQNLKYLGIALALFLPAAIIETYITPLLIS